MDNLASSMHCVFSRNSNPLLSKSSEDVSMELPTAVLKAEPHPAWCLPAQVSCSQWGYTGGKGRGFVQGIESIENLLAGIQSSVFWL